MKRVVILISIFLSYTLFATSLSELKKLRYAEQTEQNIQKYKNILKTLVSQNNIEAILMMANDYETGNYFVKDLSLAVKYYTKASKIGSAKAFLKLGVFDYNKGNFKQAKINFINALKGGENYAIKYLLNIAIIQKDYKNMNRYFKLAKENSIAIDQTTIKKIYFEKNKKSVWTHYLGDKAFEISKNYIVRILKIVSSLKGTFKNLGFKVNEYIIHNGLEPTIEIILYKIPNATVDEDMAKLIVGDNMLKKSIVEGLLWVNSIEPFIEKDANQRLIRVELEIGETVVAKIVTREIKND